MALALYCLYGVELDLDFKKLIKLSDKVAEITGLKPWPLKPVVGSHAFTHESGIHVAAVFENPFTYEPYSPRLLGIDRSIKFGKHSGTKAIIRALKNFGIELSVEEARKVLEEVKRLERVRGCLDLDDVKEIALKVRSGR